MLHAEDRAASGFTRTPDHPSRSILARLALSCAMLLGAAGSASAAPPAVPDLLHYTFDESGATLTNHASAPVPGTETADLIGTGMTQGTPYNGFVDALVGTGTAGGVDYVDTHWAPNLASSWTLSFFTSDVPASTTLFYIFGEPNTSSLRCFTNGVAGPNNWILRGPITDVYVNGGATVAPHMITFVYDISTNDIKAYLDAVLVSTVAQASGIVSGPGPFKIGTYATNAGLNGKMADFRLYTRALSPAEITDIYTYITTETPMTAEVTLDNDATCNAGADGSLTVTPTGGIEPYTYLWSNGSTDATASGLLAGDYTVTVTDSLGQTTTASGTVGEPTAIVFDNTPLPTAYFIAPYLTMISASGGTGALTYALSTGSLPTDLTLDTDGMLSGVPTETGSFAFDAKATDENLCSVVNPYTLEVLDNPDIIFRDGFDG